MYFLLKLRFAHLVLKYLNTFTVNLKLVYIKMDFIHFFSFQEPDPLIMYDSLRRLLIKIMSIGK